MTGTERSVCTSLSQQALTVAKFLQVVNKSLIMVFFLPFPIPSPTSYLHH